MAELAALEECYRERENRNDWRTASIICTLCNLQRGKEDKVLQPADVMPWLAPAKGAETKTKAEAAPITREMLEQINQSLGGTAKILT